MKEAGGDGDYAGGFFAGQLGGFDREASFFGFVFLAAVLLGGFDGSDGGRKRFFLKGEDFEFEVFVPAGFVCFSEVHAQVRQRMQHE